MVEVVRMGLTPVSASGVMSLHPDKRRPDADALRIQMAIGQSNRFFDPIARWLDAIADSRPMLGHPGT
jgi:hypothetical protein